MDPQTAASPSDGSPESPIEVVTPTAIRNNTRSFQSAPATLSTSYIDFNKQPEGAKADHKTAPPISLASKTPWKSHLDTTVVTGESFGAIKRKYEENRAASSRPSPDGSLPQRYKETPAPPPQPRVYNSARYETHTSRIRTYADLTSNETPLPKHARTKRPARKPRMENTIPYDLIASNPVRPPAPAPDGSCPPQSYKETPVPPPQRRLYNSARYEDHTSNFWAPGSYIMEARMSDADLTSDETPLPKRARTALPSWKPRTENTSLPNVLMPNPLQPANPVLATAPSPTHRPGRPRRAGPQEKTPPPSQRPNPLTPKSMRIRALERDLRISRDEAELWRKGNEGAMEMWRTEYLEAEILRRKFQGLGGERAWQEVVWSGSAAAAGPEAGASKVMAFVVD